MTTISLRVTWTHEDDAVPDQRRTDVSASFPIEGDEATPEEQFLMPLLPSWPIHSKKQLAVTIDCGSRGLSGFG
ncbi:hypothetical protein LCGC14_2758480, partial [marine sediment metagenome]